MFKFLTIVPLGVFILKNIRYILPFSDYKVNNGSLTFTMCEVIHTPNTHNLTM